MSERVYGTADEWLAMQRALEEIGDYADWCIGVGRHGALEHIQELALVALDRPIPERAPCHALCQCNECGEKYNEFLDQRRNG